jgi:hypothetical protein
MGYYNSKRGWLLLLSQLINILYKFGGSNTDRLTSLLHQTTWLSLTISIKYVTVLKKSFTSLDLGTRWRWVVSVTLLPLYLQGNCPSFFWIRGWLDPIICLDAMEKLSVYLSITTWSVTEVSKAKFLEYQISVLNITCRLRPPYRMENDIILSLKSGTYHRCCGSSRPWYADTRVAWNGLSYRCLPYNQNWTHWASVKYVKRHCLHFSVIKFGIFCVVYLLWIFKCFTDLW